MKTVQIGGKYKIYGSDITVHDTLPAQTYRVIFDKMEGPFLTDYQEIKVNEKVYGVHQAKLNKVFNSYSNFNRNLGVILSGDKGIGKSLFSKMIAQEGIKRGLPLIIVDNYFPGIASFLAGITQEVIILFDEFDKVFSEKRCDGAQEEMLTLFDGLAQGKKLFIVTCNEIFGLNQFLVNRPGRFHYHFRFEYPTSAEIEEYLKDYLNPSFYSEIVKVIAFSHKVKINYDCLRAIAFELNSGLKFEDAILDLNILNINATEYILKLVFPNGEILKNTFAVDLFSKVEDDFEFEDEHYNTVGTLLFNPAKIRWNPALSGNIVEKENLKWEIKEWIKRNLNSDHDDVEYFKNVIEKYGETPSYLLITTKNEQFLHYSL